ncbi:MAG: C_GCAxxG_C_C family protein [Eubacteriaceae bacterium]|nr:C_GCAxxG_C_C family protein [Eubacteriaceae bacterium]
MKFSEGEMTVEKVTELVSKGFMCSQCVFARFAPELGVDEALALQLASPFGGGSFYGGTCGAVVGANLALALEDGWSEAPSREQIQKLASKVQQFNSRFEALHGSILCRELLGKSFAVPEETSEIYANDLMAKCPGLISSACEILADILEEEE